MMQEPNLPTTPINDSFAEDDDSIEAAQQHYKNTSAAEYMEALLEDEIPKDVKEKALFEELWAFMNKNIKLSFLDNDDIELIESYFRDAKWNLMMSRPAYDFDFSDMQQVHSIMTNLRINLKRAKGTSENTFNERKALISQFQQEVRTNTETLQNGSGRSGGFLGRVKNMF